MKTTPATGIQNFKSLKKIVGWRGEDMMEKMTDGACDSANGQPFYITFGDYIFNMTKVSERNAGA